MKNTNQKNVATRIAKAALTLGMASLGLVSCRQEENPIPQEVKPAQEMPEQAAERLAADSLLLANALKGGLETGGGNQGITTGNFDTRVLINGSIIGYNISGYQQPYVSAKGNLLAHLAVLLNRYEYTVSFASGVLTATRNSTNAFGARSIKVTNGSATVTYTSASGSNTSLTLPEAASLVNGVLFAPARAVAVLAGAAIADWDADSKSLQTHYYELNDYGIYFYGAQDNAVKTDGAGAQKYISGEPNAFFDPSKPTIIYAHGWQKGSVNGRNREGFLFNKDNQWQNVQNYWKNAGWNVGIFHWGQIADDDWGLMPVDTEKKIYDPKNPNGMRWKKSDGGFSTRGNPTVSVIELYKQEYQKIVGVLSASAELRLIGNSLGGNLSMAMLREANIAGNRLPARVSLMDPYWDGSLDSSDGITLPSGLSNTKAVGTNSAQRLNTAGVAIEYMRSSIAGQTGYNKGVADIAAYTNFVPGYTSDQGVKHTQPTRQYFWALAFNPPAIGLSPRASNATVRSMMSTQSYWDHTGGTDTSNPSDDVYTVKTGKP